VRDFIAAHDQIFVVEQNRDAQMRSLLVNELEVDPARLRPVLHYDGTPITARFITQAITKLAANAPHGTAAAVPQAAIAPMTAKAASQAAVQESTS
jgi:2-oxoglutarate ferredoxin oxidoreductase subunit alpha